MEPPVITPQEVVESLMNDGTIDAIRLKIIKKLKDNEELKNNTLKMVKESEVLNTPGAEKLTKREMLDGLRQELETSVLEKASKSIWELILDNDGLGKEINETVERVFCRLSGREPPLFPPNSETVPQNGEDMEKEKEKLVSLTKKKKRKLKKRSFSEMSVQDGTSEVANGSPSIPKDPDTKRRNAFKSANMDSEPLRCRRTDGRSWRCPNEIVEGLKFCQKHLSRGRALSKKSIKITSKTTKSKAMKSSITKKESNNDISASDPDEDGKKISPKSDQSPTRKSRVEESS